MRAIVLFGDCKRPWMVRLLRKGFRHVSVTIAVGKDRWLIMHPGSNVTLAQVIEGGWQDAVIAASSAIGAPTAAHMTAIRDPGEGLLPIRPYTCVEEVKRLLGLRLPWVLTPWQLYRHLQAEPEAPVIDAWREEAVHG